MSEELKKLSEAQVQEILSAHRQWVDSDGKEGARAELIKVNLQQWNPSSARLEKSLLAGSDIQQSVLLGAQLQESDLAQANLFGVNFEDANLQQANLRQTNLKDTVLLRTNLRDADLQDADLLGAKGLQAGQLGGANLSGAKLPEYLKEFGGLAQVEELSKSAKKLFTSILLGCVYCWLTISSTTDARLLTNSSASPLPIIQTEIPIVGFYWVAPLLLLSLYLYFHFYLQRLWEGLADLPTIFPDGMSLYKKVYPWLLNGLVSAHFIRLKNNRPPLSRLQNAISILLAWWIVPATIIAFWSRYLKRHDWIGTSFHIVLVALSVVAAIALYWFAVMTLSGKERKPLQFKTLIKDVTTYKLVLFGVGFIGLLYFVSAGAIEAVPARFYTPKYRTPYDLHTGKYNTSISTQAGVTTWVPRVLELIGYESFADLTDADVSSKPASWREDQINSIKGARLYSANLKYALANGTFLIKADLTGATLEWATLKGADLRSAILIQTDLRKALMSAGNLSDANMQEANLYAAILENANLRGARLVKANLKYALLSGASLEKADLRGADLEGAALSDPDYDFRRNKKFMEDETLRFELETVNYQRTNLTGANFKLANLNRARLQGVDLKDALGLAQEQVNMACMDENTLLPEGLKKPKPCQRETRDQ